MIARDRVFVARARSRAGDGAIVVVIVANAPHWKEIGGTRRCSAYRARSALDVHWRNRPDCRRSLYYVDGLILMSSDVKRQRVIVNLPATDRDDSMQVTSASESEGRKCVRMFACRYRSREFRRARVSLIARSERTILPRASDLDRRLSMNSFDTGLTSPLLLSFSLCLSLSSLSGAVTLAGPI